MNNIIENGLYFTLGVLVSAFINHFFSKDRDSRNWRFNTFNSAWAIFIDERKKITDLYSGQDFILQEKTITNVERFISRDNKRLRSLWEEYKQTEENNRKVTPLEGGPFVEYKDKKSVLHSIDLVIEYLNKNKP